LSADDVALSMIMRPPQHGQVGELGSTAALAGSPSEFETTSSSRARASLVFGIIVARAVTGRHRPT
jgi:hypothetical protein